MGQSHMSVDVARKKTAFLAVSRLRVGMPEGYHETLRSLAYPRSERSRSVMLADDVPPIG